MSPCALSTEELEKSPLNEATRNELNDDAQQQTAQNIDTAEQDVPREELLNSLFTVSIGV